MILELRRSKKQKKWTVFNKTEKITVTTTVVLRLTHNEEYCFRVSAVNEIGTSEASSASRFVKVSESSRIRVVSLFLSDSVPNYPLSYKSNISLRTLTVFFPPATSGVRAHHSGGSCGQGAPAGHCDRTPPGDHPSLRRHCHSRPQGRVAQGRQDRHRGSQVRELHGHLQDQEHQRDHWRHVHLPGQ